MIKHLTFLILSMVCFMSVSAQTPITRNHNTMRSGDLLYKLEVDFVEAGESGENKVWTLGKVTDDSKEFLQEIIAKDDTIAIIEQGRILHYLIHGDTLFFKGLQQSRTYCLYDKERPVMRYPFQYGDSIYGKYNGKGIDENLETSIQGWGYSVADGTGILTDGEDTLRHITRLHLYDDYVEHYADQAAFHIRCHHYLWFCAGYRYPVMESTQRTLVNANSTEEPLDSITYMYLPAQQYSLSADADNDFILQQLAINANRENAQRENNGNNGLSSVNASLSSDGMSLTINYTLSTNTDISFIAFDVVGNVLGTSQQQNKNAGEWQEFITLDRKPIAGVLMLNAKCGGETTSLKVNH